MVRKKEKRIVSPFVLFASYVSLLNVYLGWHTLCVPSPPLPKGDLGGM